MLFIVDWFFLIFNILFLISIPWQRRKIIIWDVGNIFAIIMLSLAIWFY